MNSNKNVHSSISEWSGKPNDRIDWTQTSVTGALQPTKSRVSKTKNIENFSQETNILHRQVKEQGDARHVL
jgi:hypothetical protein